MNQPRIVMLHGVRVKPTNRHLLRLAAVFREAGFCVTPSYGYVPAFVVGLFSWLDDRIAQSMSGFIEKDDVVLGHSNGATLAYLISKRRRLRGAILVNAALEVDELPDAEFVHIYYNRGDCVAQWSAIIPFHPWGAMGGLGYIGKSQPHVTNIDQGNPPERHLPALNGHSDIFSFGKVRPWAKHMASLCLQSLKGVAK